jgi:hypothetical protein
LTESSILEIQERFESMNLENLLRFLEFMFVTCLHDEELDFSQDRLERFQDVLSCCPRNILACFLRRIREVHDVLTLLEGRNDIWIKFFVGLFELEDDSVHYWIQHLSEIHQDDFVLNMINLLARETLNQDLTPDICQIIYDFVREIRNVQDESQDSEPPPYREVDADLFVCMQYPSLHPLALKKDDLCGMCYSVRDELNDDKSIRVFRSMPCCEHKQIACHGCLVKWATSCNTPEDLENERKDTNVFVCPFCRAERKFFPDENWFNFHQ